MTRSNEVNKKCNEKVFLESKYENYAQKRLNILQHHEQS